MAKVESPFLIVNPKSYLYGEKSLELAKAIINLKNHIIKGIMDYITELIKMKEE